MLKLEFPHESHRGMYEDMIEEWSQEDDFYDTSPGALFRGEGYEDFLRIAKHISSGSDPEKTPSTLFFLLNGNKILGGIDIRHNIENPILRDYGGHIGYGIRPTERKKGYATEILRLGILKAKDLGIEQVLIAHHPENTASEKVILKNGGEYFETKTKGSEIYKKYWIC